MLHWLKWNFRCLVTSDREDHKCDSQIRSTRGLREKSRKGSHAGIQTRINRSVLWWRWWRNHWGFFLLQILPWRKWTAVITTFKSKIVNQYRVWRQYFIVMVSHLCHVQFVFLLVYTLAIYVQHIFTPCLFFPVNDPRHFFPWNIFPHFVVIPHLGHI